MKTLRKSTFLVLGLTLSAIISQATGLSFGYVVAGGVALGALAGLSSYSTQGLALDVNVEMWKNDIIGNLFKANPFIEKAYNADSYVIGGKIVHIPTSGAKPNVVKNRTSLPAVIKQRTDTDIVYQIDEFTTDPFLIPNIDEAELSYDKRASILADHQMALDETVGDWLLRHWASYTYDGTTHSAGQVATTGTDVTAHVNGTATGNRKKFVKENLKSAMTYMNKRNIPKENRFCLLDSDMLDQLLDDTDLKARDRAMEADLVGGVVAKLYGFQLMERSSVLTYNNAATKVVKDPGAAEATTDNAAALCWQQNSVERALGMFNMFQTIADPTMFGDVYSMLLRMGGRLRRQEGVVAIVQAAGS